MSEEHWNIPNSWEWTSLETIAEINPKLPFEIEDEVDVSFIPMKRVEKETGQVDLSETRKFGDVKGGYTKFIDNDIIFAKITPCMENGKVAILKNLMNGIGFGSTEFHVVRLREESLSNQFYFYFLLQKWFRSLAMQHFTGTVGHRRVPTDFMKNVFVPVAPSNEQIRIVGKVEKRFSRLDAGVRSLQAAQTQLEQYRQITLKQAYIGKLTHKWRQKNRGFPKFDDEEITKERKKLWEKAENNKLKKTNGRKGKYKPPLEVKKIPDLEIPDEWSWQTLDKFTYYIIDYRGKTPPNSDQGIPIISAANIKNGQIITNNPRYVSQETYEKWTTRGLPQESDLIITTEAPVGEVALYPKDQTYLLTRRVLACQTFSVENEYLMNYFKTRTAQNYIMEHSRGTTVPRILKPNLLGMPFPIPSIVEQEKIVDEINQIFSSIKIIQKDIINSIQNSVSLKSIILKKAFEGRLIPQDPKDEPAQVLLECIKAQRVKQRKLM